MAEGKSRVEYIGVLPKGSLLMQYPQEVWTMMLGSYDERGRELALVVRIGLN